MEQPDSLVDTDEQEDMLEEDEEDQIAKRAAMVRLLRSPSKTYSVAALPHYGTASPVVGSLFMNPCAPHRISASMTQALVLFKGPK